MHQSARARACLFLCSVPDPLYLWPLVHAAFVSLLACWLQATFEAELLSQWGRVGVAIPKENALPRTPKSQDALDAEQLEGELLHGALHVACVWSEALCVDVGSEAVCVCSEAVCL